MEAINELELRKILKLKLSPQELLTRVIKGILNPHLTWDEKRPFLSYLFLTGRHATLASAIKQLLDNKARVPFDLYIAIASQARLEPKPVIFEALIKGFKKQNAADDVFASRAWDRYDKRLSELRNELVEKRVEEQKQFKENLIEKFWFLRNQRMTEQAGRVLRRMIELFPEDKELQKIKHDFDEQWARDVLATHMATLSNEKLDRTHTAPSGADTEMLNCFLKEGEKLAVQSRELAADLAVAFWFMEDANRALEILAWAPPGVSNDWMRAEMLVAGRRFVEALELLNQLEVKYIEIPETTFGVSYLRAQCLHHLGQHASALEILQGIVRVRPNYRSANALILEWSEGVSWE